MRRTWLPLIAGALALVPTLATAQKAPDLRKPAGKEWRDRRR